MSGPVGRPAASAEVRRGRRSTWIALVAVTVGGAVVAGVDPDADPVVSGLFACAAALEMMLGAFWWRRHGGR